METAPPRATPPPCRRKTSPCALARARGPIRTTRKTGSTGRARGRQPNGLRETRRSAPGSRPRAAANPPGSRPRWPPRAGRGRRAPPATGLRGRRSRDGRVPRARRRRAPRSRPPSRRSARTRAARTELRARAASRRGGGVVPPLRGRRPIPTTSTADRGCKHPPRSEGRARRPRRDQQRESDRARRSETR